MKSKSEIALLVEGDVIELGIGHTVYAMIPKHFVYANCRGDFSMTKHEVHLMNDDFDYLRGKYIIVRTSQDGGGTGHGPHDIYPDGWHVWCESLDGKHKVDFYQTGCFTAMIKDLQPLGRAEKKWVVEQNVKFK